MTMDFLKNARRHPGAVNSRTLTVTSADSGQHAGSDRDEMLPRSHKIHGALYRSSTRGALVLSPSTGFHQVGVTAVRADAIDGLVPGDEVTGGVPLAAKERATLLRTAF